MRDATASRMRDDGRRKWTHVIFAEWERRGRTETESRFDESQISTVFNTQKNPRSLYLFMTDKIYYTINGNRIYPYAVKLSILSDVMRRQQLSKAFRNEQRADETLLHR